MRNMIHRYTCKGCGLAFVCERPTGTDCSWNRYALHECKGRRYQGYEHDEICTDHFNPIPAQSNWSPYD